jgi:peptidoglycan/xylan/chitin deacetylase (PgdA/CDA1 family)
MGVRDGVRRMKQTGVWAMKRALHHSGLLALARLTRQRARGLVLRYHALTEGTGEVTYADPSVCLPVDAFRLQMAFLARAYSVVPLEEIVRALEAGRPLPPRAVAVTFDDGYADNHRLGLPVLRRLGIEATVYVSTASLEDGPPLWMAAVRALVLGAQRQALVLPGMEPLVLGPLGRRGPAVRALTRALVPLDGKTRAERLSALAQVAGVDLKRELSGAMLSWAQVRELSASGWTIGAHTATHVNVALAPPEEAEQEIAASRDAIEAAIGTRVPHFAYPNTGGQHRYFDADVAAMLRRLGFRSAATSRPGSLRPGVDAFALPRVGVSPRLAAVSELAAALERQRLAA